MGVLSGGLLDEEEKNFIDPSVGKLTSLQQQES